jgi:hypothetical protein
VWGDGFDSTTHFYFKPIDIIDAAGIIDTDIVGRRVKEQVLDGSIT